MGSWKAPTIKSSETTLISPESPTAPEKWHLKLSNLDRLEKRAFTPVILLYEAPGDDSDFPTVVASLKESLRKTLVEYYPFAGRFTKGEVDGLEEVRCDDAGAFFTEAVVEDTLEEIGGFESCPMLTGMEAANLSSTGWYSLDDYKEIPPLVIQVTYFKCKSIALAVNWHHQVCDGFSGMTFLRAWSELARGLPITSRPDHRRHLLSARNPPQPLGEVPTGFKLRSMTPEEQGSVQAPEEKKKMPCKVEFILSGEEIQQLKKQAAGAHTSGECISAHLWRLVTKSRGLNKEDTTNLFTIVDGRKRMKDFPVNYFGNCIFIRRAECTVGEVLDMPLGHLAQLIHDSVSGVTDEYVRSLVDYVEVTGASNLAWFRPKQFTTHDLNPTFWRFFPLYELDFGFGKPTYGGRNSPLDVGSTGFSLVLPTPSTSRDGSVLINAFLFPEAADDLVATLGL
ncbi:hypothetical protein KC19_6G105700 [Ceratodon purpureus]|uniref:Uncharacterized protein n=1 Tax=Ceratodon purpureus TaxID=3225 RepID=A0A8T0HEE0_CERPU|nr:hypothetical protein KC19_6G105700 [Ceratodon purpureus]